MKRLVLVFVTAAFLGGASFLQFSGASFTSAGSASVAVTTDRVQNWLHLYSQSTDPDGLTGYCTQSPGTDPAATGSDETLTVDLGSRPRGITTTCSRVLTIETPTSFPTGTSVTITVTRLADPTTGSQPITSVGFGSIGSGSTFSNPISLGVGQKRQMNLRVRPATAGVTYHPTILITVRYSGMTATYYQYTVPVTVTGS